MKMSRIREREVSTRLIRPTLHEIQLNQVLSMAANFDPQWEIDGKITVILFLSLTRPKMKSV